MRVVMQESALGMTTEEKTMINRVLDLQNRTVRQVMIPLAQSATISVEALVSDLLQLCRESGHSRIPAWQEEQGRRE